jgi:hypothetical protein
MGAKGEIDEPPPHQASSASQRQMENSMRIQELHPNPENERS